jgi:hypothetical protein
MDRINEIFQENFEKQRQEQIRKKLEEKINMETNELINEKTKEKLEKDLMFSYFETDFMNSDVFRTRINEIKNEALKKLRWCGGFTYNDFENITQNELSGSTEKALKRMYTEKALNELIDEDEVFQIGENKYIIKELFKKVYSTMMVFNELDETTKSEILGKILADAL